MFGFGAEHPKLQLVFFFWFFFPPFVTQNICELLKIKSTLVFFLLSFAFLFSTFLGGRGYKYGGVVICQINEVWDKRILFFDFYLYWLTKANHQLQKSK